MSGRRHLVTGAGSGIGDRVARRLHDRGDALILLARSPGRAEELAGEFPGADVVVGDLADPSSLIGIAGAITGPVDSLLHVAGVVELAEVADVDLAGWQRQLDVNLTSPAVLTRELLPLLRASRGMVVFVNSTAGFNANPSWAGYSASKFGLRALADALRAEERGNGVAVSTVFPSRTATPMQESVHAQEGRAYDPTEWSDADTVAATIVHLLDLPTDSSINEVTIRPR
ncbi:SDR family oxidoreductase [Nocardioides sp. Bht2]|uniref:SDR family oxidoreductase n=1 Tax=Nocardioides sp. Bht2 TaxID=3392297 RepID=UPI0039B58633